MTFPELNLGGDVDVDVDVNVDNASCDRWYCSIDDEVVLVISVD